jgi:hypothetical protein
VKPEKADKYACIRLSFQRTIFGPETMVFQTEIARYINLDCRRICNNMAALLVCNPVLSLHTRGLIPREYFGSSNEVAVEPQATLHSMNITTYTLHRLASDRIVVDCVSNVTAHAQKDVG